MTTTTRRLTSGGLRGSRWITAVVAVVGLAAVWWLLGLVIGGQCDVRCITGNLGAQR